MDPFDIAQSFIDCGERAQSVDQLASSFQRAIESLGFRYFACCSHTVTSTPAPGAVMLHNYPSTWANAYLQARLHKIDPVLHTADRSPRPFSWSSAEFRAKLKAAQKEMLAAAGTQGLVHGYTVPIQLSWLPGTPRASCSLVSDGARLEARRYDVAERIAIYLYASALRLQIPNAQSTATIRLAPRERQCLELAARGHTDCETARALMISESTARTYILRAMERTGAATRAHAVAYALMTRQVAFGDVLRIENAHMSRASSAN